jgi:Na+/melibiose symporter-like transporter
MEDNSNKKIAVKGDDLNQANIFSYGIGHFMNDLTASCWFFFLPYFLIEIVKIEEVKAGYIMLAGQVADGIATPLVGIYSDRTQTSLGKRTPWYIAGTILVMCSFTLIFVKVIPDKSSDTLKLIYYIAFASLFNIGWASVQVSHMALLPSISINKKKTDLMIRIRTGFTFLAQTTALCISFFFFWLISNKIVQYEFLACACIILGLVTSLIFLFLCREMYLSKNIPLYYETMKQSLREYNNLSDDAVNKGLTLSDRTEVQEKEKMHWCDWLKKPDFYAYIFVYMFVRLSINITQSVIPFYIETVLGYEKTKEGGTPVEISIVLLISTVGSIVNSLFIQGALESRMSSTRTKRLLMITIASLFVAGGCLPMFFLNKDNRSPMFYLAFVFGIGFSQALSTVSSLINDVVGSKGSEGAFVYGAYSFTDKLSCGIVLALFLPLAKNNKDVLQWSMSIFPPASLICAFIIVLFRGLCRTKKLKKDKYNNLFE